MYVFNTSVQCKDVISHHDMFNKHKLDNCDMLQDIIIYKSSDEFFSLDTNKPKLSRDKGGVLRSSTFDLILTAFVCKCT